MFRRYSVRDLSEEVIDSLLDLKAFERRRIGAILEDCISTNLDQLEEWNELEIEKWPNNKS